MNTKPSNQVWLIIDSFTFGGIETHLLELANGLKQHQVEVKVWLIRHYESDSQLATKLNQAEINVEYLDQTDKHYIPYLLEQIKSQSPALIHAHGYKASLVCKLARVLTGIRQISTYHAGETPSGRVWLYDFIDRYSAFISSYSIAVSEKIATKLPVQSTCFNNFIDDRNLEPSRGTAIAFVGRLSEEKAPDRILELAQLNSALNFEIYGSGPMAEQLQNAALTNVTFHGHQTNMNAIWSNIGLLIICSRYEGLPMTALEAMGRGIPVLALNVGNLSRLIVNHDNGFLADSMAQLNEALTEFTTLNNEQLLAMQTSAIKTIKHSFSSKAVIPQLLQLYFPSRYQSDFQIEK
ncbi:glycosyltransferase [Vibrio orientalis CIP 102891 = ATCC 33934]|uniref:Glycosyltransferase n=1 Tax=Vibrio orientalis CIP 102891 = ATCC 33934 TaxID=675816 RepID=C9QKS5_VIBOR|nr:glycosyltransferase family 4 protein [Vibrio orientalis]EEX92410.1 glycosyltransferase [Vibrio orientalis CIP 102891 = ATCC 33934]EGU48953.1 glycosyltransferase [Vibrio orientalis CIP 102891 = ATCC 33934]